MSAGMYARHIGIGHLQAGENRYFQALHEFRFIIGLMVIAKEVEKAMNRKMRKSLGIKDSILRFMGRIAAGVGSRIDWDVEKMESPDRPDVNRYVRRDYCPSWEV